MDIELKKTFAKELASLEAERTIVAFKMKKFEKYFFRASKKNNVKNYLRYLQLFERYEILSLDIYEKRSELRSLVRK